VGSSTFLSWLSSLIRAEVFKSFFVDELYLGYLWIFKGVSDYFIFVVAALRPIKFSKVSLPRVAGRFYLTPCWMEDGPICPCFFYSCRYHSHLIYLLMFSKVFMRFCLTMASTCYCGDSYLPGFSDVNLFCVCIFISAWDYDNTLVEEGGPTSTYCLF